MLHQGQRGEEDPEDMRPQEAEEGFQEDQDTPSFPFSTAQLLCSGLQLFQHLQPVDGKEDLQLDRPKRADAKFHFNSMISL